MNGDRRNEGTQAEGVAITETELARAPGASPRRPGGLPRRLAPYLAVGTGAALGANLRYGVGLWAAARWPGAFPWGTLLINLSGSLLLGLFLTLIAERFTEPPLARLFVATGVLGAYTTFSTFSAETVGLLDAGQPALALAYVTLSLVGGYAAAWVGIACAHVGRGG